MSSIVGTLAGIGMAVGPPLIYVDQAREIIQHKDSSGFSHDVCGVIMIANILRCFFYLGHPFETPLLVQSFLLIISQGFLLKLCLQYRPIVAASDDMEDSNDDDLAMSARNGVAESASKPIQATEPTTKRPFNFWQWEELRSYIQFLGALIAVMSVLQIALGRFAWYVEPIGFLALFIESTLPIPQFFANLRRRSTEGFSPVTLAGWTFGDLFKTVYYILRRSPVQFVITAIHTVCWDLAVTYQMFAYWGRKRDYQAQEEVGEV